jgi:hypothetical protein
VTSVTSAKTILVADDTAFVRDRFKVAIEAPVTARSPSAAAPNCWRACNPI